MASAGELDLRYRVASVTKAVVSSAVLLAVEERAISLDDPAGPAGSTIRHLLCHASGLDTDSRAQILEPGRRRIYSNSGFEILAQHVEAATGIIFAEYLAEAILDPLGMSSTCLDGSPAHGLISTAADLSLWATEMLNPQVLHPSSVGALRTVQFPELDGILPGFGQQRPNPWGLGVEIAGTKSPHWTGSSNSEQTFGHFGKSGCFVWVDPIAELALIGCGDSPFGGWAAQLWPELSNAALAEFADPGRNIPRLADPTQGASRE